MHLLRPSTRSATTWRRSFWTLLQMKCRCGLKALLSVTDTVLGNSSVEFFENNTILAMLIHLSILCFISEKTTCFVWDKTIYIKEFLSSTLRMTNLR